LFGEAGIAIATGLLTFVILVFAEVSPKTMAALHPERFAFPASYALKFFLLLFYPLVYAINTITNSFLSLFGVNKNHQGNALTQEELKTVVNETGTQISTKNQKMLVNILDLDTVTVEDIMVPRNEIIGIDLKDNWEDIMQQITQSLHQVTHQKGTNLDSYLNIK